MCCLSSVRVEAHAMIYTFITGQFLKLDICTKLPHVEDFASDQYGTIEDKDIALCVLLCRICQNDTM